MQDKVIFLENHSFFKVSGSDAGKFLQGLITQDIYKITSKQPQYSCFLTPQGKFLYDFFIHKINETDFLIEIHVSFIDDFIKKLSFYKLRSNIIIEKTNHKLYWSSTPQKAEICYQDPRNSKLGYRIIGNFNTELGENIYRKMMIQNNIPYGAYDLIQDKTLILEAGFDDINAIDYEKGCYIGQELTARMHHTISLRKKLFALEFETNLEAKNRADILNQAKEKIGELYSHIDHLGFGMIRLELLPVSKVIFVNTTKGHIK